ncbi:hypothetical protein J22TS3_46020 [Paenibacillus sp. J22TS3]|nr:hypothetical protein J22TS3_46020 [Paenibacillus sp. J22TS3]
MEPGTGRAISCLFIAKSPSLSPLGYKYGKIYINIWEKEEA